MAFAEGDHPYALRARGIAKVSGKVSDPLSFRRQS